MHHSIVSPNKIEALAKKMDQLGVREKDIEESFVRSSGPGGQKVNKTSTCVVLKHTRTGIVVKCMETRSRELNRFLARRRLVDRIAEEVNKDLSDERKRIEKIRRQKRKRSKRAKEKVLADKKMQAVRKKSRQSVGIEELMD